MPKSNSFYHLLDKSTKRYQSTSYEDGEIKLDILVPHFKNHLVSKNFSRNTVKNYLSDIKQFINWLEKKNI